MEAVVLFQDSSLFCLKILKKGFRHCSLIVEIDGVIMLLDPLSNFTHIQKLDKPLPNVTDLLRVRIQTPTEQVLPPSIFTCVEFVKRALGVRKPFILTPYQLYKYLKNVHTDINVEREQHG